MRRFRVELATATTTLWLASCSSPPASESPPPGPTAAPAPTRAPVQAWDAAVPQHPSAALPDLPPVEYEVRVGAQRFDWTGEPIVLADGRSLDVVAKPRWTYSVPLRIGGHLSLEHSPALHVTTIPTGGIKVATADAVAEINVIRSELDETDGLASVEEMMATMTRVRQREAVTYRVAGRDVTGTRLHTDTAMLDLLVASAGKGRQLRVMVTASSSVTDVEPLRAVVETITFAKRAPAPHVTITAHGPAGDVSADATLGKAVTVAGEKVTFAKRATVREQLRTMRFEHAPELTARLVTGMRPPTVGLFFGSVTVHAVLLPRSITSTDLLAELEVRVSGIVPLSRTVAGYTYPGIATDSLPGGFPLRTHVYWFEREGRHFAVAITAPPDDVTKREPLVDAILTTLR